MSTLRLQTPKAPFLVWPVARREFYAAVAGALGVPIAWGLLIFGWRALLVLLATVAGAMLMHQLLKRLTKRGKELVMAHTLLSALMLVALSQALWPPLVMLGAGALMVLIIWIFGGTGRERVHGSLAVALMLTALMHNSGNSWLNSGLVDYPEGSGAILAHNRLFMGDLSQTSPALENNWPDSAQIRGQDAVVVIRPDFSVNKLLKRIREATTNLPGEPKLSTEQINHRVNNELQVAFADRLPNFDNLMLGVSVGSIGSVSAIFIVLSGLWLAYRNILRSRSCLLFLASAIFGLAGWMMLTWGSWKIDFMGLGPWQVIPGEELLAMILYEFFSSDILLAAVFILALPGTEPITPAGRRWFLILAGVAAGYLHQAHLPLPGATLALLVFQPLAPMFDALFIRRSWLNAT